MAARLPAAILEEVTRRLVEACHPDKIYLFGSVARGDARPDSDYDFLIVVADDAPRDILSGRRPHSAVSDLGLFTDIVVYTRTYFAGRLHLAASIPATVLREGRLLYESEGVEPVVKPVDKAKDTADWMRKSKEDLRAASALLALDPPAVGNALYYCQQAAITASRLPKRP